MRGRATPEAIAKGGWKTATVSPGTQSAAHAAIKTQLLQPIGAAALEGQQGISAIIASAVAGADPSSIIAGIDAADIGLAMTGRATGANTSPAITEIASSRRMVI